jgi:uncharacterized secreted repeat protein (TIGR03808 family)
MNTDLTRRRLLAGTAALAALAPTSGFAQPEAGRAREFVNGAEFGLVSNNLAEGDDPAAYDQTAKLQQAVDTAAGTGLPLFLAGGYYAVGAVELPSSITIQGVRGATQLLAVGDAPILRANHRSHVVLRDLGFDGVGMGAGNDDPGLLVFIGCENVELDALTIHGGRGNGVHLDRTSGRIENLIVFGFAETGIFATDNWGLDISRNRVFNCGNGGIRVWAREPGGHDGTVVAHNDIYDIHSEAGGNGQNGNGINVFRAVGVTLAGNRLRNCAFSAIRLNAAVNTVVSANTCLDSGEVAIFSEFEFSGSVIADNIVDGAAQGISITNFDAGGRLATCSGNLVRNIYPSSRVNPDTTPAGIFAEADAVVTGNVVEMVPGVGIGAGWGPHLRDVTVSDNLVRGADIGIGVSVAEGAGRAVVTGNRVTGATRGGIAGLAWWDVLSDDLVRDAAQYPNIVLAGNAVG